MTIGPRAESDATPARSYYSISAAAAFLGVSRVTIWRWIQSGRLSAARLGHRTVRISREEIDRLAHRGVGDLLAPAGDWAVAKALDHIVMFYEADHFLADSVAEFLAPALQAGDRAVAVATPLHHIAIAAALRRSGVDVGAAREAGRFVAYDASKTLARFMEQGVPRADRFSCVVDELLEGATTAHRARIFGEMVAILVEDGQPDAALALESMWETKVASRRFSLLCAYPMRHFRGEGRAPLMTQACMTHSGVVPAEGYSAVRTRAGRLREVAALQQKAASLELEVVERKRLADELAQALNAEHAAREQAEAALRQRDEFLSTASHELRTPMAALSLQAQLVLRRWQRTREIDPARLDTALRTIGTQADKLGRLVTQLLDTARLDSGKLVLETRLVDLAGLIRQVVATTACLWEDNPLDLELSTSVTCAVDPLRLEQVFVNLLDNAAKHSPPGAPIHVSLLSSPPNGWVELSVRDFGPGIPPEMREHIFERFFQASPTGSRAGLGLGLYLSRTIVELHGGNISAHYPPDGGVRFVVRLPACPVISPTSS